MTIYNGIECPCCGTLEEIHKVLITELGWIENQVSINGWKFTITKKGFRSNQSGKEYAPSILSGFPHTGTAILIGLEGDEDQLPDYSYHYQIVTVNHMPHISKRCIECGCQINQDEIKHGACNSCYSAAVN